MSDVEPETMDFPEETPTDPVPGSRGHNLKLPGSKIGGDPTHRSPLSEEGWRIGGKAVDFCYPL